jgi:hypothetical protein
VNDTSWLCTLTELKSHLRDIILFSAQVREKKEILWSKAPFKKHAVTKQPGPSSSSFRKKIPPLIADASTNTGQFINTAK